MLFKTKGYVYRNNRSFRTIVDANSNEIISLSEYNKRKSKRNFLPKKIEMLMFMIDGISDLWGSYGGRGFARLNTQGGYGYDRVVKKMLQKGEIKISRKQHHTNNHGGNPTINITYAYVTDKGRAYYKKWKNENE